MMKEEITQDEFRAGMSGNAYVVVQLREDRPTTPGRIRIRAERNCEHSATICVGCADSWALDYQIFWGRTAGGRRLQQRLASAGAR